MNRKDLSILVQGIYCFVVTLFLLLFSFFAKHEILPIYQYGFGLDGQGNIYIGSTYDVFVYNSSGEKINQFPAGYTRYLMSIDDEKIFIKGTEHCLVLDLNGNVLNEIEIDSYGDNHLPLFKRYKWYAEDGTLYELKNILLRPQILREDKGLKTPVWQLPLDEYLPKLAFYLIASSDLVCALSLFYRLGLIDKKGRAVW